MAAEQLAAAVAALRERAVEKARVQRTLHLRQVARRFQPPQRRGEALVVDSNR